MTNTTIIVRTRLIQVTSNKEESTIASNYRSQIHSYSWKKKMLGIALHIKEGGQGETVALNVNK